ncbi:MAG: type VI secretion system baseplate subunit TssF [Myxococcota bacterium]
MFSKYYQSELTYLRELGREFARANPTLTRALADREGDPEVERLLEGFAFLTARIRERIDDALPEVIDSLGQLTVPQLFRQTPACSIVQFTPNTTAIRGHYRVEQGTELASRAVAGTKCTFRTTGPVDLLPIRLEGAAMDPSTESRPKVRLRFRADNSPNWPEHGSVRLFLDGPLGLASTTFLWLMEHLSGVEVESRGQTFSLIGRVSAPGLDPSLRLLPWPETVPEGLSLLQEYFTLPAKLRFVDVAGFGALPEEALGDNFDLVFHFRDPPKLPERLTADLFQLHCVPVVNLFEADGAPIKQDSRVQEHLLRALNRDPHHTEIYSVNSVTGIDQRGSKRVAYEPFFAFAHLSEVNEEQRYYSVRRNRSPIDNAVDTYLSVLTPADVPPDLEERVLSLELSCTNRHLPAELRPGDICEPTAGSPTVAGFRNITNVTRPTRPPIGAEKHWRLVSHLALNTRSLTDAEVLGSLLALYNAHEETDQPLYEANRLRIRSIRTVKAARERRVFERVPMVGLHTEVELDESGFTGLGDAYLFGCALQRLFVSESPINCFQRLTVHLYPSNQKLTWKPETGTQPLL